MTIKPVHKPGCPEIFAQYGAKDCHCGAKARLGLAFPDAYPESKPLSSLYDTLHHEFDQREAQLWWHKTEVRLGRKGLAEELYNKIRKEQEALRIAMNVLKLVQA